jgi:GAF domain-containing protein
MQPPPLPDDERERLEALRRLGILDTPPSESFDRLTRIAADVLQVPIVLVSLVDEHRQWFKSRFGLGAAETPREVSFCGHAVFLRAPLVVPDARTDPRFDDNPLVTGEPHVGAYLGIPIHTRDGQPIGTLCAIDHRPRQFSNQDILFLSRMARAVEHLVSIEDPESRHDPAG